VSGQNRSEVQAHESMGIGYPEYRRCRRNADG
jgi:hypothetical protein